MAQKASSSLQTSLLSASSLVSTKRPAMYNSPQYIPPTVRFTSQSLHPAIADAWPVAAHLQCRGDEYQSTVRDSVSGRGSYFNGSLFHVSDEGQCSDGSVPVRKMVRWFCWGVHLNSKSQRVNDMSTCCVPGRHLRECSCAGRVGGRRVSRRDFRRSPGSRTRCEEGGLGTQGSYDKHPS